MNANFGSLLRFVETLEREVQGRESAPLPPEVEALLKNLVAGKLSPEQRKSLCELLRREPAWLAWLAEEVKKNRHGEGPGGAGGDGAAD